MNLMFNVKCPSFIFLCFRKTVAVFCFDYFYFELLSYAYSILLSVYKYLTREPTPQQENSDSNIDEICNQLTQFHISDSGLDFSHNNSFFCPTNSFETFSQTSTTDHSFAIFSDSLPNISDLDSDSDSDTNSQNLQLSNSFLDSGHNTWEWRESSHESI